MVVYVDWSNLLAIVGHREDCSIALILILSLFGPRYCTEGWGGQEPSSNISYRSFREKKKDGSELMSQDIPRLLSIIMSRRYSV